MRTITLCAVICVLCSGCFVNFVAVDKPRPVIPSENLIPPSYMLPNLDRDGDGKIDPTKEEKALLDALVEETKFSSKCIDSISIYNDDAEKHNALIFRMLNK